MQHVDSKEIIYADNVCLFSIVVLFKDYNRQPTLIVSDICYSKKYNLTILFVGIFYFNKNKYIYIIIY